MLASSLAASDAQGATSGDPTIEGGDTLWWSSDQVFVHAILRWWDIDSNGDHPADEAERETTKTTRQQSSPAASSASASSAQAASSTASAESGESSDQSEPVELAKKRKRRPSGRLESSLQSEERATKSARLDNGADLRVSDSLFTEQAPERLPFAVIVRAIAALCSTSRTACMARIDSSDIDRITRGMDGVVR